MQISFRPLTYSDLPLLHRWLNDPEVVRWWEGDDVSWDAVVRDYGPTSNEPTEHWIASVEDEPIGWIQCYAAVDYGAEDEVQHWWRAGVDRTAAGIDYLIGEADTRGRGWGTAMIRTFVTDIVFGRHPEWSQACASPLAANKASVRALEKAGFGRAGTFEDSHGQAVVMAIDRQENLWSSG
jgi:aminoglycoside 6'-N-acetyltransferase